ncbi:MAG: hypothetical protein J6L86_01175 [Alphaproteobacteria bacterium]|nr:hypothetical protein [Alphaproteobacteria bacterium]
MKKNIKEFLKTVRNKMLTLGLTVSGLGTASAVQANTSANSSDANVPKTESASFDYKKTSLNVVEYKSSGVYKGGIEVNFAECTPHHLGWVFESGMKPGIVDPTNSYIGLFQMDLGATMTAFLKENKDKYPKLAALGKTKEMRTIKNGPFQKLWKELDSPEFRQAQADFMEKHKYAPVFEELRTIDGLDIDRRGDALHGAVASAANQYRKDVVVKMMKTAYHQAAEGKKPNDVQTEDIISNFYDQRAKRSPGLKNRLLGVTNKKGKKIVLGEKDMALDYQRFLEKEQVNLFAQKELENMITLPLPAWSAVSLHTQIKSPEKEVIPPLALNTPAKKNVYKKREIINRLKRSR